MVATQNLNIQGIPNLVLLQVADEDALLFCNQYLTDRSIRHEVFREPDLNNSATALATEVLYNKKKRNAFRPFQLYRGVS